jgi:hypothetical protein
MLKFPRTIRDFVGQLLSRTCGWQNASVTPPEAVHRVALDGAVVEQESFSVGDVQLATTDSGAVLAAVALFQEQQEKLIEPPERGPILVVVVFGIFAQADVSNAALVVDGVAHAGRAFLR